MAAYKFCTCSQVPDNLSVSSIISRQLPVILTPDTQRNLAMFTPWLSSDNRQPFIIVGPEGCGKELLLRHSFEQLRSVQVAVVHCSAQTMAKHIMQKLSQVIGFNALVISATLNHHTFQSLLYCLLYRCA